MQLSAGRKCLRCCGCRSPGQSEGRGGRGSPPAAPQQPASPQLREPTGAPRGCEPEPSLRRPESSCAPRGWEPHALERAGRGGAGRTPPTPASGAQPWERGPYLQHRAEHHRLCSLCLLAPERPAGKVAVPESAPGATPGKGCWRGGCGWENPSCLAPSRGPPSLAPWKGLWF